MDETKVGEKFLPNPLDTPEILTAQLEKPLLSTEDFIKTTPHHELKNMFGAVPDKAPEPKSPTPPPPPAPKPPVPKITPATETPKIFVPAVKASTKRETPTPPTTSQATVKPKRSLGKFILGLLVMILILLVGLYIWGGILKDRGVSPTIETLSQ
ncbi:MAG: hypothetical protein UX89_C0018G0021 [Parcubacteria group bacterium GW2011_GWA2_47_16]|nr:MAG: hypothetical protein UX89_C0018G0021 [Parcubacteria group bacterium GW2011_GWA2_47_16]